VSLNDVLLAVAKLVTLVFVLSSMLGMGMSLTVPQIVQPLKNARLVLLALLANFLLAPLLAYAITRVIPLEESLQIALLVVGTAAGAPFLPKLAQFARGNLAFAVALMVLLMVASIVYMPIVVPLLVPGASANPWDMARSLVTLLLIPLAVGLLIRWRSPAAAARWRGPMNKISSAAVVVLLFLGLWLNVPNFIRLIGTGQIVALFLFIAGCLSIGYICGGRDPRNRSVVGLGTAQRDMSASLVVAAQSFAGTDAFSIVLVIAILLLLILLPAAKWMSRRGQAPAALAEV
jgi:predicted Na+-dependent transporter